MAKFNWFEGGRRVTLLFQVLVGLCIVGAIYFDDPAVTVTFDTAGPERPWTFSTVECGWDKNAYEEYPEGVGVGEHHTDLCFRASNFGGQMLVPYKLAGKGSWYGAEKYSPELTEYTKQRAEGFSVAPEQKEAARAWVKRERWKEWRKAAGADIGYGVLFIAGIWALSWVVGWIVRGFAGIPAGEDHRVVVEKQEQL